MDVVNGHGGWGRRRIRHKCPRLPRPGEGDFHGFGCDAKRRYPDRAFSNCRRKTGIRCDRLIRQFEKPVYRAAFWCERVLKSLPYLSRGEGAQGRKEVPVATKIMNGFPLRRCSWFFNPIVSNAPCHRMIRWLDSVCLRQITFKVCGFDGAKHQKRARGVANGT